ncbi:hypothetical protein [Cohnella rhizosphaerae]|uniref:Uncharacterized protein n=1 Tax=Cohnella rhizosphaerae TaxID=1457232 RepID=A0A9X4KPS2_9BACL|nr:hypothetical protein [Cohnella rhizosphaerae]MDG0808488.1 hypothetical protein [Cohnella rhizosphaerae]
MRKSYVVWIVVVLIVASWGYNLYSHQTNRLPEGRFLSHRIEATASPGDAFWLYYITNNDDKRLPLSVSIEGLSALQFYPVSEYMTFRNQRIYRLIGHFNGDSDDTPFGKAPPLTIHSVDVYYSDGTRGKADIGEMIVYRGDWASGGSISQTNSSSSSNGTQTAAFQVDKPVTLNGFSSAFLNELGSTFTYELHAGKEAVVFPQAVEADESISFISNFHVPADSQLYLQPVSMRLRLEYSDADGTERVQMIPLERQPYPSEAAIRAYVKAQRGATE